MNKFRRFAAAVIAVLLLPAAVLAETVEINKSMQLVGQSEQFELRSDKIGEDFLIQVGLPASYGSADKRYPVVYLLDGNTSFGAATDIARRLVHDLIEPGIPEVIVVGIDNGRWGIYLYGTNITDEDGAYLPAFAPNPPNRLRPQTFGINVKFRF